MPLILGTNSIKDSTYNVANSARFNDGSVDYLDRTFDSGGSRRTFTVSLWVKRSELGATNPLWAAAGSGGGQCSLVFDSNDKLQLREFNNTDSEVFNLHTNALFRDVSAWYHIVASVDTTQSTSSNRAKLYVNGVEQTYSTASYPNQNYDLLMNSTSDTGKFFVANQTYNSPSVTFDGYLTEVVFINNSALDQTSFGEFDEDTPFIWKPKNVSGLTFGTNGFYLDFENASSLGADVSGESHNFTVNNLTSLDQSTDTCTNNFCTLNPLSADEMTFSNGNLDVAQASDDGGGSRSDDNARGTIGVNSGKWYWETKVTGATAPVVVGICFDELKTGFSDLSGSTGVYAIQNASGTYAYRRENGTTSETSGYPNPVANNIINVAFDADNGKLYIGINGTYYNQAGTEGNPATGSNPTFSSIDTSFFWLPWIESRGDNQQALMNFGSGTSYSISSGNADAEGFGNFEYAVPSGYFALCTKNLAEYG